MPSEIRGVDNFDTSDVDPKAIGVDQTWQNMTSSRAFGITYINTTGKPISVSVQTTYAGDSDVYIKVDGLNVFDSTLNIGNNRRASATAIVPNNSTYDCGKYQGALGIWMELR